MTLVYIDAENLSYDTVKQKVSDIKQSNSRIYGKVYGSKESVRNSIQYCLLEGFEFVETSILSPTKKNLADTKIIVDCMYDVLVLASNNVKKVYMISNDNDFLPLIYTLRKMNIEVETSLIKRNEDIQVVGTKELNRELRNANFYSNKNLDVYGCMYDNIINVVGDVYSDDVICEHISVKTNKFILKMADLYGKDIMDQLEKLDRHYWSFKSVMGVLKISDETEIYKIADIYTRKIYGFIPKQLKNAAN